MKRYLSVLLVLAGMWAHGQGDDPGEFKTIFGDDFKSGGYGAPELKVGPLNGESSLFLGGRGGWIIGHKFVLGGGGYGMTNSNTFMEDPIHKPSGLPDDSTRVIKIDMGYGGVLLEYIAMPRKAVHLSFPVLIGAGGANLGARYYVAQSEYLPEGVATYDYVENSGFFLVEPGVYLELNMTKFFRLTAGGTYRFVSGTDLQRLKDNNLSGFTFSFALKFGSF